ncbi:MAG: energy transducer TonB [Pyrinomonadaceae bacterium]
MEFLKRALPFVLTLMLGVAVGSLLKRTVGHAPPGAAHTRRVSHCRAMMAPMRTFESEVFTAKDVTRKADILYKPEPLYTFNARRNQVTGTVRLRMVLAADATVRNIVPLATLPEGLTEQAVAAASDIEFTPALKDGRPVSQYVTVEYNFNIY